MRRRRAPDLRHTGGMLARSVAFLLLACGCTTASPGRSGSTAPTSPAVAAAPAPAQPVAAPAQPVAIAPGDIAITDASVVPMSRDGVLAHHTVVVRGDRIIAVAPTASLAVPAGVTAIDGSGKWLLPGL